MGNSRRNAAEGCQTLGVGELHAERRGFVARRGETLRKRV